jgi:uncharacterized protein (TIGR02646 family)
MNHLDRQSAPSFWSDKERQYLDRNTQAGEALRKWTKNGKTIATWFHERVRPSGDPNNCAYCDGTLGETSSETIDHFIPCHVDRALGLAWTNLYPACQACNTDFKGTKWSRELLRPDVDPVEDWIAFDPDSGRLYPAPEFDRRIRTRVRLTICVFGLNEPIRRRCRRQVWKDILNAINASDLESLEKYQNEGPYRLVARLILASRS